MIRILTQSVKILSIVALTLLVAGGSVWFFNYWTDREQSDMVGRTVTVSITEDDDTGTVASQLKDKGLISYPIYFETRMRFASGSLNPGTYQLRIGMSVPEIINVITVADDGEAADTTDVTVTPAQAGFQVTFIEGQRIEQFAQTVQDAGLTNGAAEYLRFARDADAFRSRYSFLEDVPPGGTLEGFLFPSTYTFGDGVTAEQVVDRQLQEFEAQLTPDLLTAIQQRNMSVYDMVTVASIVEREAQLPVERPTIASVYWNRIDAGMALNADPSQQYGVGTAENWWPQLDTELLEQSKQTPYDTYNTVGLPPGPIANPGAGSLQAAAQPEESTYLYFVTLGDGSGGHRFTSTYDEHLAATCEEHPDWAQCTGS